MSKETLGLSTMFPNLFPNVQVSENETSFDEKKAIEDYNKKQYFKFCRETGIPEKYDSYNFSNINRSDKDFAIIVSKIEQWIKEPSKSLVFSGTYGSGKTLLGTIIARELKGKFVRCSYLINEIKQGFSFNSKETANEVISRYGKYPVLILDELGRGIKNADDYSLLFQVINENIENDNILVIISNLSIQDICKEMGNAMGDRLHDFFVINFTNLSFRGLTD